MAGDAAGLAVGVPVGAAEGLTVGLAVGFCPVALGEGLGTTGVGSGLATA